jgi:hypothetical protein
MQGRMSTAASQRRGSLRDTAMSHRQWRAEVIEIIAAAQSVFHLACMRPAM